ncbi:hypothetical protein FNF28_07793 [Cafeteria roenbergensis]|uniref:Uncharacterized protein n=1 Tax=Cafeteria roenbergensis TaxID=33653 RepID=A0A5A8BYM0_CAFRO|nr:hypothetical protein FNF28_07793 [Cafeteria roenbergensis]
MVAVERFYFESMLPLFDTTRYSFSVGLRAVGSTTMSSLAIEWGSKYLYDYRHVGAYVNGALQSIAGSLGIEDDNKPTFFFDAESCRFGVATTEAFRGGYQMFVSEDFHYCLHNFPYAEDTEDGGWWRLVLERDVEIQPVLTLELLSPVRRFLVDTTLPIIKSMLPNPQRLQDASDKDGGFMVDMKYFQDTNQHIIPIPFSVGKDAVHRWSNLMPGSNLRSFEFSFFWLDWTGDLRPLVVLPQGTLDIKCVFKTLRPLA